MKSNGANRGEGQVEDGRYSLEGLLEEGGLKIRVGEDLDGRRVMVGILGSNNYVTNYYK